MATREKREAALESQVVALMTELEEEGKRNAWQAARLSAGPAVFNRKAWGGHRSWISVSALAALMAVIQAARQRVLEPFTWLQNNWLQTALTQPQTTKWAPFPMS